MNLRYEVNGHINLAQLCGLRESVGWDPAERKLPRALAGSCAYVACYSAAGNLIGFIRAIADGAEDALIVDLAVHPSFQRMGIGTTLVKMLVRHLRTEVNISNISVLFRPELLPFYQKLGFKPLNWEVQ